MRPINQAAVTLGLFMFAFGSANAAPPAHWTQPQQAFKLFGNTYYVGTRGLSALLITSDQGHVLIDTGLPQSAELIEANIRGLGFDFKDVKWILNSHAHSDHAGGIAALQAKSGAKVASSAYGAQTMRAGRATDRDPQHALGDKIPPIAAVEILKDRQALNLGELKLTMHETPGHTPGGTSWTWRACEAGTCLNFVYADSLTSVSDASFKYSGDARYPEALADLRRTFARIASLECDVLITPHPEATNLWTRVESGTLAQDTGCRDYVEAAEKQLERRLQKE